MSATSAQSLVQILEEEVLLRAALVERDEQYFAIARQKGAIRQEKSRYERAKWFGPLVTQVDVWPLYALYILVVVGPSSLLMFGLLRAIWLPTWLAGAGALSVATIVGYYGWRLRRIETDIRQLVRHDVDGAIQRLQVELDRIESRLKPLARERHDLQGQLSDLLCRKERLEREVEGAKEKLRQEELARREKDERDQKQVKLQLLHSHWEDLRGIPFEEFLASILKLHGYLVELTPASNDQGVDLVAVIAGQRIAIQAKGYANSVGNESVQQVIAGMRFYRCARAAVITNSTFTASARSLAESNECLMIDRKMIPMLIMHGWPKEGIQP